jgi:hypothetical protein
VITTRKMGFMWHKYAPMYISVLKGKYHLKDLEADGRRVVKGYGLGPFFYNED